MKNKKTSHTVIAICKLQNGKLAIAGDRRCSWGFHMAQSMEFSKINKKDNILVGATGTGDLCELFVETGGFSFPEKRVKCINSYMFHTLKPAVHKFLVNQKMGEKNELRLSPGSYVEVVIGIEKQVWSLIVHNPLDEAIAHADPFAGEISLSRIPAIPYATGCGGVPALAVLNYIKHKQGFLTKDDLREAMVQAAFLSPGCDDVFDILVSK